jgi:CheY-like chemotaxis protein
MNVHDVLWIEDDSEFVDGVLANFKEDRDELGFAIIPWHYISLEDFENNSHLELNAISMSLVCVDYNLPGGVNGNEIIATIRSNPANLGIKIIFYSALKNETELKEILEEILDNVDGIFFAQKDTLEDQILALIE